MRNFWSSIVVGLIFVSTAIAQVGSLQIEGPHEVEPGQLVRLSANTLDNETPFWIVLEPINLDYESVDGGKRLLFSSGCQRGNFDHGHSSGTASQRRPHYHTANPPHDFG